MLELVVESWIWYAVVLTITIARFISRSLALGSFRKLQTDDFIMVFALCTYTALIVTINIVADDETNLLPPGFDVKNLTSLEKKERRLGSKLVLVVEQNQIMTIWAVKACLLIMYYRLTLLRKENRAVVALAVYVTLGFIFMEIFYFAVWCRPFHRYWAIPTTTQCSAATHHLITNAVFNISSDVLTLALALQMFIRSKLPLERKLVLCGIFGLGIFVIFAAALNKFYSFHQPFGSLWTFWYVRESSTAMIVANLPFLWTLLRRIFKLGSFDGSNAHHTDGTSNQAGVSKLRFRPSRCLDKLRAHGLRMSLHVIHAKNVSANRNGTRDKRAWVKGSRRRMSHGPDIEESILPQTASPLSKDTEAQRQPWDDMHLGDFLSDSNLEGHQTSDVSEPDIVANGAQRRRSWGARQ